jgi:uncharacterized protein YjbI with pentapeptide repeats
MRNISQSLMTFCTTGICENAGLADVDITAELYHAGAISAYLDYEQYSLDKFDGKIILESANLSNASFRRLELKYINLRNAVLTNADLSDVIWENSDFFGASLTRARLNRAILRGANFENAMLPYADLLGADLSNSNFVNANLDGVDIRAANFRGTNCTGAIFNDDGPRDPLFLGADFTDANLEHAKISEGDLHWVYLCRTTMPDGKISNRDAELVANLFDGKKSSEHPNG